MCSLLISSFLFFFAKIFCNNFFCSNVRFSKSNYGISIISSRMTSISGEMSFIAFLLFSKKVLLLNTGLGVGEGFSPLGHVGRSMFETTMVSLDSTLLTSLFTLMWGAETILLSTLVSFILVTASILRTPELSPLLWSSSMVTLSIPLSISIPLANN